MVAHKHIQPQAICKVDFGEVGDATVAGKQHAHIRVFGRADAVFVQAVAVGRTVGNCEIDSRTQCPQAK